MAMTSKGAESMTESAAMTLLRSSVVEERIAGLYIAVMSLKRGGDAPSTQESEAEAARYLQLAGANFLSQMLITVPQDASSSSSKKGGGLAARVASDFLELAFLFPGIVESIQPSSPILAILLNKATGTTEFPSCCPRAQMLLRLVAKNRHGAVAEYLRRYLLEASLRTAPTGPKQAVFPLQMVLELLMDSNLGRDPSRGTCADAVELSPGAARHLRGCFVAVIYGTSTSMPRGARNGGDGGGGVPPGDDQDTMNQSYSSSYSSRSGSSDERGTALLALETCLRHLDPSWTLDHDQKADGGTKKSDNNNKKTTAKLPQGKGKNVKNGQFVTFLVASILAEIEVLAAQAEVLMDETRPSSTANAAQSERDPHEQYRQLDMLWSTAFSMMDLFLELLVGKPNSEGDETTGGPWAELPGAVILGFQSSMTRIIDCCLALHRGLAVGCTSAGDARAVKAVKAMLSRAKTTLDAWVEEDPGLSTKVSQLEDAW